MPAGYLLLLLIVLGLAAYIVGRSRAMGLAASNENTHSRPTYHGFYLAIATAIPALLVALGWLAFAPGVIEHTVASALPADVQALSSGDRSLIFSAIDKLASSINILSAADLDVLRQGGDAAMNLLKEKGILMGSAPQPFMIDAALHKANLEGASRIALTIISLGLAVLGFFYASRKLTAQFRARNAVELVVEGGLILASTVAVLTTVGIVMSVLFESIHFFRSVPVFDFLFGTVWDPRFSAAGGGESAGQFGLLPLLWGTLFITFVAMLVAVPIGLLAAVYMSEYASSKVRGISKPVLEILAGIPTIVYGFFALTTMGPFLRNTGSLVGLDISANSVLTAGFVMGVMIIPFVSSLSDDIISAVPNSLREGSYGLGATQSETIKRVVLPAALPGIVGAVLLAVSRAIGETMIVVLAAGIAANLTLNPFQPVTTMTVKIVSQLTGDLEFNSPQTLVAFALGLTLFIITLGLNVVALYIVRKYREQYE
ncbi:phosphate ABC transporter permease subunit PstC [Aestuariivirga sp.]|uniref:phosphate ABC transporter permease subunit PstC n=1 Tax=Aestuariivirga sp. TaxID=2650926 RepID=UPI0039E54F7B